MAEKDTTTSKEPKPVKIKNIWTDAINFESGLIASGEIGLITAAEAEALSDYVQKV
jgi:hypothetical protein